MQEFRGNTNATQLAPRPAVQPPTLNANENIQRREATAMNGAPQVSQWSNPVNPVNSDGVKARTTQYGPIALGNVASAPAPAMSNQQFERSPYEQRLGTVDTAAALYPGGVNMDNYSQVADSYPDRAEGWYGQHMEAKEGQKPWGVTRGALQKEYAKVPQAPVVR